MDSAYIKHARKFFKWSTGHLSDEKTAKLSFQAKPSADPKKTFRRSLILPYSDSLRNFTRKSGITLHESSPQPKVGAVSVTQAQIPEKRRILAFV